MSAPRSAESEVHAVPQTNVKLSASQLSKLFQDRDDVAKDEKHKIDAGFRAMGGALSEFAGGVLTVCNAVDIDKDIGVAGGADEVKRRKQEYGENTIPERPPHTYLEILWESLQDFTLWMLIAAALVSIVIWGVAEKGEGEFRGRNRYFRAPMSCEPRERGQNSERASLAKSQRSSNLNLQTPQATAGSRAYQSCSRSPSCRTWRHCKTTRRSSSFES